MVSLSRECRLILRDLFKAGSGKLDAFTFYRRYFISPSRLAKLANELKQCGFVKTAKGTFAITDEGRQFVLSQNIATEEEDTSPKWKSVPEEFCKERIKPWKPYLPLLSHLDKSFSKQYTKLYTKKG